MHPKCKIIKPGSCTLEAQEIASPTTSRIKYDLGIGGGSNVILIEADKRILVDTGFEYEMYGLNSENVENNRKNLVSALEHYGYSPEDIEMVFITHWHLDHYGNLDIFKRAQRIASRIVVESKNLVDFISVDDGEEIAEGVKVVHTPGHTLGHASVLVNAKIGHQDQGLSFRIALAGDAIVSLSYFDEGKVWAYNEDFYDKEESRNSMKKLAMSSDVIIPGHGIPFVTFAPKWMED
jgi:glyoxylase-like metal-dependent hydrolase (beta-lactamase superfamily II)